MIKLKLAPGSEKFGFLNTDMPVDKFFWNYTGMPMGLGAVSVPLIVEHSECPLLSMAGCALQSLLWSEEFLRLMQTIPQKNAPWSGAEMEILVPTQLQGAEWRRQAFKFEVKP